MEVERDGRTWRIGTAAEVAWLAGRPLGRSVLSAVPPVFAAYGTLYVPEEQVPVREHERAVVGALVAVTAPQPWWLGYLCTGPHDVVFPGAPRVSLYLEWSYVLVEGGPSEALRWRYGHMRSAEGHLPDLFFPFDRSWLVTALWDDAFACVGGSTEVLDALAAEPLAGLRRVHPDDEDVTPPGSPRD